MPSYGRRNLTPAELEVILAADVALYPNPNPVSNELLAYWCTCYPSFFQAFTDPTTGKLIGNAIFIPLNEVGFENHATGKVPERDLTPESGYLWNGEDVVGFYVFHVEREEGWKQVSKDKFGLEVMRSLGEEVRCLRKTVPQLRVCGITGLCATEAGEGLFRNVYKFREESYYCNERILRHRTTGEVTLREISNEDMIAKANVWEELFRCKMMVGRPCNSTPVWDLVEVRPRHFAELHRL